MRYFIVLFFPIFFIFFAAYLYIAESYHKTEYIVCDGLYQSVRGDEVLKSSKGRLGVSFEKFSRMAFWVDDTKKQRASFELIRAVDNVSRRHFDQFLPIINLSDLFIAIEHQKSKRARDRLMIYYSNRTAFIQYVERYPNSDPNLDTIDTFDGLCKDHNPLFE